MKLEKKQKLIITTLLAFVCLLIPFNLRAQKAESRGIYFICEVETNQTNKTHMIDEVIKVLQARLEGIGVKGIISRLAKSDDRIEVKIFGTHNTETIRGLFVNHQLEFRAVVSRSNPYPYDSYKSYEEARKKVSNDQEIKLYKNDIVEQEQFVILERKAIIDGRDVKEAKAISRSHSDESNAITFSLSSEGAEAIEKWTGNNINNYLAIVLNDRVINIAFIRSVIFNEGEILGQISRAEAVLVASALQSGQLPAKLKIVSEGNLE